MSKEPLHHASRPEGELLSMLLDLLPDYFYIADAEMRLHYVNKAAAEYVGLLKEEIVGRKFRDIEPDRDSARPFIELGQQIMTSGVSRVSDLGPFRERDGTSSYFRRYDIPFRHPISGEPMLMGLAQNITDRVEREQQERRLAAMHREMQIAQEIQRTLMPKPLPTGWLDLAGFSIPATYAGGDFFDWLRTPDGSIVLALGDVSGHGVGPALIAAECRAYWRSVAREMPLRAAVERLNHLLLGDLPSDHFITFAAAAILPDGRVTTFAAGHGPLVIARSDGAHELLGSQTFPLGLGGDLTGDEALSCRLSPGDSLLIVSDGITEARNIHGRQWNTSGLLASLAQHRGVFGSALLRAIDLDNAKFAGEVPSADDRTIVVATYTSAPQPDETPLAAP